MSIATILAPVLHDEALLFRHEVASLPNEQTDPEMTRSRHWTTASRGEPGSSIRQRLGAGGHSRHARVVLGLKETLVEFDICLPNCMEGFLSPSGFAGPSDIVEFAQHVEGLGYGAVWGFDFVTPTPRMGITDAEPPNWYELLITLAHVSAVTERLKIGTGVVVAPNRDVVILAKQVATLDQFSNGRLLFGLGLGRREEFDAMNPRAKKTQRGRILDETVEALHLLLSRQQKAHSYKGESIEFEDVSLNPKPVQNPLPMYVAAHSQASWQRAARWGMGALVRDKEVVDAKRTMKPVLEKHGKSLTEIDLIAWADLSIEPTHEAAVRRYENSRMGHFRREVRKEQPIEGLVKDHWIGTVDEVVEKLLRLRNEGIDHLIVMHTATDTLSEMREQAEIFAREVMPAVAKSI